MQKRQGEGAGGIIPQPETGDLAAFVQYPEIERRLMALRVKDGAAYTQLTACQPFRLSDQDMAAQLDMWEEENGETLMEDLRR